MRVFFDTSVLVAASVSTHEQHGSGLEALRRVASGADEGVVAAHSLAELYAVLTRLPVQPRIYPGDAARIVVENVVKHCRVESLTAREYESVVVKAAAAGAAGGAIYDLLILAAAEKAKPRRIHTFNVADFRRLAPHLAEIISAP